MIYRTQPLPLPLPQVSMVSDRPFRKEKKRKAYFRFGSGKLWTLPQPLSSLSLFLAEESRTGLSLSSQSTGCADWDIPTSMSFLVTRSPGVFITFESVDGGDGNTS